MDYASYWLRYKAARMDRDARAMAAVSLRLGNADMLEAVRRLRAVLEDIARAARVPAAREGRR